LNLKLGVVVKVTVLIITEDSSYYDNSYSKNFRQERFVSF